MRGTPYAKGTRVPVTQTIEDIRGQLARYDGDLSRFQHVHDRGRIVVRFELAGRSIRFEMDLPANDRERMRKYRGLFLSIKGKLESSASGIETIDEAFLAQIVADGDETVFQRIQKAGMMPARLAVGGNRPNR